MLDAVEIEALPERLRARGFEACREGWILGVEGEEADPDTCDLVMVEELQHRHVARLRATGRTSPRDAAVIRGAALWGYALGRAENRAARRSFAAWDRYHERTNR